MDGNQVRLLSCGFLPTSFSVCWCVSWFPWPVCLPPGFLCLLVMLLRIRGFLYLNLWEFSTASACVIFHVFFQFSEFTSGQDALPTVLNSGFVHTLPKEQASTVQQILFRGVMAPSLLPVQGQAFIRRMWDFSECVIVIVIVNVKNNAGAKTRLMPTFGGFSGPFT